MPEGTSMKYRVMAGLLIAAGARLAAAEPGAAGDLAAADAFVDAFYSFDADRLRAELAAAPESIPLILYYQGWAQGGGYAVLERHPCMPADGGLACPVTVKDDLLEALGSSFRVTDTFHLALSGGAIVRVGISSDDPPAVREAEAWVRARHPERVERDCAGYFDGGPTPQDCVRTMVAGFREFAALRKRTGTE